MRKLVTALGITFALTALADQPFKLPLDKPFEHVPLQRFAPAPAAPLNELTLQRYLAIFMRRPNTCYFIQQVNRNIQTPLAKPQMVPLAASAATMQPAGESDCTNRAAVSQAISR